MKSEKDLLATALRQYRHNDSSGLIFGYDKAEVIEIVEELRTQLAKVNEDYKAIFSAFESCQDELKKANERVNNIINGDMTPEDYHKISGSKFVIEKKLKALDDLLEEIQCSVVVPRRYEQFQEPYLEGIKHCIQFIECQQEQLRKEQE